MSLPGLGLEEPEKVHIVETTQHDLQKEAEWRFEVPVGKYVQVKVRHQSAGPRLRSDNDLVADWHRRVVRH
jgi:hypothetical protein